MSVSEAILVQAAKEAVEMPPDFGYRGEVALGKTWGFTPFSRNRDSDSLENSNYERIVEDLTNEFPNDFSDEQFDHWAVGWIDQLLVRVYDKRGQITPAFRRAVEIAQHLAEEYPVYDEDDYSRREFETDMESLENAWRDVPSDLRDLVEKEVEAAKQELYPELFDALRAANVEWGERTGTWPKRDEWEKAIEARWPDAYDAWKLQAEDWAKVLEQAMLTIPTKRLSVQAEREELAAHLVDAVGEYGLEWPTYEMEYILADTRLRRLTTQHIDERLTIAHVVEEEILNRLGA